MLMPTQADAAPLLQGWAIVDNTVGEDWKDVELSLVAGAPQSFIQELSKPYYTRRPVVGLPQTAMLTPQTHEGTMEGVDRLETFSKLSAPPPTPPAMGSFGIAGGVIGGVPGGATGGPLGMAKKADRFSVKEAEEKAAASLEPAAYGQDLGDLFQYNLKEKVTILKNHSALVPIINSPIKAEKVTLWSSGSPRSLRALWITNSSGLTLDGGAFNVLEDNAFAGEGIIDPLKPDERRLLSYAVDQGVRIEHKDDLEARPITHIKIAKGVMVQTSEQRDHQRYTIRNTDAQARDVVIEHPVRAGWKLADGLKPEETSASFYRFRVKVEPNKTSDLKVAEVQPLRRTIALSNVTNDQIRIWFNDQTIKPELEQALEKIVVKKNEIAGFERGIQERQSQEVSIKQDQERMRPDVTAQ